MKENQQQDEADRCRQGVGGIDQQDAGAAVMPIGNDGFDESRPYALGKVLARNAFERRIGIEHAHHETIVAAENVGSVYSFLDMK